MHTSKRFGLMLATLATTMLLSQVFAAPVTVTPTGDSSGSLGAVSGTGNASAADDCSYVPVPVALPGCVAGVAASATGNATACESSYYGYVPCTGVAGSIVGDAAGCDDSYPSSGLAPDCMAAAASALGDARACDQSPAAYTDMPGCIGVAASGTGNASACNGAEDSHWPFLWTSCVGVAASATGNASACGNDQMVTLEDSRCIGVAIAGCDLQPAICTHAVHAAAPTSVAAGADADEDGFPSNVTLEFHRATVDADTGDVTIERDPSQDVVVAIDPNDGDPNVPLAQSVTATVPTGVTLGPDADDDDVPSRATITFTRVTVDRSPPDVRTEPAPEASRTVTLDPNDNNENVPAQIRVSATFPSNVAVGPDADNDTFPATLTVEFSRLTVDRRNLTTTIVRAPTNDLVTRPDPNDNNPNVPAQSVFTVSFPSNVVTGPDADNDDVPATVTVQFSRLTIDRRDLSHRIDRTPTSDLVLRPDPNDNDPNVPAPSVVGVSFPSNVVVGPDADNDTFPATARVEMSRLTIDRRDLAHRIERAPQADVVARTDPNDNDPNVPVTSIVSVAVPTNVVLGPDNDGDEIPAYMRVEFSRLTIDRRNGSPTLVRDPASDRTIAVDPNDNARAQNFIDASVEGPARASVLAVSLAGDAHATCDVKVCLAASALGDASACGTSLACAAASGTGDAQGYIAASGAGDATSCQLDFLCTAASGTGNASGHDVAASATGDAQSTYLAVSGAGSADGAVPLSALGACNGETCFSLDGDGHWLGVAPFGDASGIVAASGEGAADGGLVGASATGDAEGGLVAVSATGDAQSGLLAASGTGDARAPVAVSP